MSQSGVCMVRKNDIAALVGEQRVYDDAFIEIVSDVDKHVETRIKALEKRVEDVEKDRDAAYAKLSEAWKAHDEVAADRSALSRKLEAASAELQRTTNELSTTKQGLWAREKERDEARLSLAASERKVPTKISSFRGDLNVLLKLWKTVTRQYCVCSKHACEVRQSLI